MEYHVYWLLKSSCFEFFWDGKYGLVLAKKLMERWYLLIAEKLLFWTFWEWELWSFFEPASWWKDYIYWLLKSSCFEFFGDWKYGLFFSQKSDGKMIFNRLFWSFHDIPGLGKYGFSYSDYSCFSKSIFGVAIG